MQYNESLLILPLSTEYNLCFLLAKIYDNDEYIQSGQLWVDQKGDNFEWAWFNQMKALGRKPVGRGCLLQLEIVFPAELRKANCHEFHGNKLVNKLRRPGSKFFAQWGCPDDSTAPAT